MKLICWGRTVITKRDYTHLALRSVDGFRHQDRKHWLLGKCFPLESCFYAFILNMWVQMCAHKIMGRMEPPPISNHSVKLYGQNKVWLDGQKTILGPLCFTHSSTTHLVRTSSVLGARDMAMNEAKPLPSRTSQARTQPKYNGRRTKTEELTNSCAMEHREGNIWSHRVWWEEAVWEASKRKWDRNWIFQEQQSFTRFVGATLRLSQAK